MFLVKPSKVRDCLWLTSTAVCSPIGVLKIKIVKHVKNAMTQNEKRTEVRYQKEVF